MRAAREEKVRYYAGRLGREYHARRKRAQSAFMESLLDVVRCNPLLLRCRNSMSPAHSRSRQCDVHSCRRGCRALAEPCSAREVPPLLRDAAVLGCPVRPRT